MFANLSKVGQSVSVANMAVVPVGIKADAVQRCDISEESVVCVHLCFDNHVLERQAKDIISADFGLAVVPSDMMNFTAKSDNAQVVRAILDMFQIRSNMILFCSDQMLVGSQFLRTRSTNVLVNQHLHFSIKESNKLFRLYNLYPSSDEEGAQYLLSFCLEIFRDNEYSGSAHGAREAGTISLEMDHSGHMFGSIVARFRDSRQFSFSNLAVDLNRGLVDMLSTEYRLLVGAYHRPHDVYRRYYRDITFDKCVRISVRRSAPGVFSTKHSVVASTHGAGMTYGLFANMLSGTTVSMGTDKLYYRPVYSSMFKCEEQINAFLSDSKTQKSLNKDNIHDLNSIINKITNVSSGLAKMYINLTNLQRQCLRFYMRCDAAFIHITQQRQMLLERMPIEEIHACIETACRPTGTSKSGTKTRFSGKEYASLYNHAIENMHADDVALRVFENAERTFIEYVSKHLLLGYRSEIDSVMGRSYWETISSLRMPNTCVRHFLSTTTAAMNTKLKRRSCIMYNIVLYYDDKGNEVHVVLSDARGCNFQYKKRHASEFSKQDAVSFKFIFVPVGGHNNSFWHIIDYFYKGTINVMYISSEKVKQCIQQVKEISAEYVQAHEDIYITGIKNTAQQA